VTIRIVTGIARRGERVLLVASRYANHPAPLWTLPGGRQEPGELASETIVREMQEETGLVARIVEFAYVSESYDGETHVVNLTFEIETDGEPHLPREHDHVAAAEWISIRELERRMTVAVVREPLLAHLRGDSRRYFGFHDAGVTIQWLE